MSIAGEIRGIMARAGFTKEKKRQAYIWAAKWRKCPRCNAPRGKACINLAKIKREYTYWPHEERIDLEMLLHNLKARGYR